MYFNLKKDYIIKSKNENIEIISQNEYLLNELKKSVKEICFLFFILVLTLRSAKIIILGFVLLFVIAIALYQNYWIIKINNKVMTVKKGILTYKFPLKDLINCITSYNISKLYMSYNNKNGIRLEFFYNKKIKYLELPNNETSIDKINILADYFITKKQLNKNPDLELIKEYSYLRDEEANKNIEDVILFEENKSKEIVRKSAIQFVVLLLFIIIITIIAFILRY